MSEPYPPLESDRFYHIYSRANGSEDVFREPRNYGYFLALHSKYISPVADTFAYCLLKNHFHLLVRIKSAEMLKGRNPTQQFSNWFNGYARAYNNVYKRHGSLFQRPFRRIPVLSDSYLATLVRYIHRNPQKHGFVDDFREWEYSSYHMLTGDKLTWLNRAELMEWFGARAEFERFHGLDVQEPGIQELIGDDED